MCPAEGAPGTETSYHSATEHLTIETLPVDRKQVPTVFWNANTWEGSDVVVMRITSGAI
jgi:hypothetical protein